MRPELIHDRGRGPEIVGTRITVYNLLPNLLDATASEAYICKLYDLTPEQVAAARAHVLNHPDEVLARHMEIEARIAQGNPEELTRKIEASRERFRQFRVREDTELSTTENAHDREANDSSYRNWFVAQVMGADEGS